MTTGARARHLADREPPRLDRRPPLLHWTIKVALILALVVLVLVLAGCEKSGTISSVEWSPSREGSKTGTCRVFVKNAVDQDGNSIGFDGKTRFSERGMTKKACYATYVKGNAVTWGTGK